ncbi:hypothetical protein M406DRAFT_41369 [Cryphonectria parasitica EP155]|uniref:RecA family profile 1 domain-containing protein n=1 Tax=Cryphonectria parasitica (strain ATCC 38755 / EP155) TaxID=660469 RepID=A0A9P4Y6Z8_CRYP1|nr:uncharacterized protein M406DRAFT_41369 [Cryphonectria parasitica EP155]KAF3767635.1 hypothetical protein M406DRAFT_41369 [Cryphonectria parasitica EP155]
MLTFRSDKTTTISAARALDERNDAVYVSPFVPTGLPDLDQALLESSVSAPDGVGVKGGMARGQITELWGPPGVGKTALGVVWVDCFHPVCQDRIAELCTGADAERTSVPSDPLSKLVHYCCPSLAHFIALLCRPTRSALPLDTALVVVDSLSALINHAFPRIPALEAGSRGDKGDFSPSSRRIHLLQYIVDALQKLAATHNAAVVVLTQCATRMQAERAATLIPAVVSTIWEGEIETRVALFRDWSWHDGRVSGVRLATVQKVNNKVTPDALEKVYAFEIESTGLIPVDYNETQAEGAVAYTTAQKRKLAEAGFELPESEEDEYGWREEDDSALPGPPPQWQGSEDILLGKHPEREDDESDVDSDDPDPEQEAEQLVEED